MSIYGGSAFSVRILFILEIFGIKHILPKFLGFAETLPFPLAFILKKRKKMYVGACSSLAAWQGAGSTVRPYYLHASAFMEVIIY